MDPHLDQAVFIRTVTRDYPHHTLLFGLRQDGILLSVAAAHLIYLIDGATVLWIFDMVTSEKHRSHGCGKQLLSFIEDYARRNGFTQLRVHSKRDRKRAHEFYVTKGGFTNWCVLFKKALD